jgi:deazaflavin-dependent oxidoreductase (nitroreductase family)
LHHTGAKSGAAHITPLAYLTHGRNWLIFAANSGRAMHPGWYYNLCENRPPP